MGFDLSFAHARCAPRPFDAEAYAAIERRLAGAACRTQAAAAIEDAGRHPWALAYALVWLSVASSNSVMPPWVRHQFPEAGRLVRRRRDNASADRECDWCRERHDPRGELTWWFGFAAFRPDPAGDDGRPRQQTIVEAAMAGEHVLGILPTGADRYLRTVARDSPVPSAS